LQIDYYEYNLDWDNDKYNYTSLFYFEISEGDMTVDFYDNTIDLNINTYIKKSVFVIDSNIKST
jgi:hypothetical protein